jgi:hypothetical protein
MAYRLPYTTRQIEIGKAELPKFKVLGNARDIRQGKVENLTELLETGEHFQTGIVVNVRADKWRLLDGTHRYLATSSYLTRHPTEKVWLEVHFYQDLTDEEERTTYTVWNMGTKQNTSDFLKQYWDTLNIQKKINSDQSFPLKVSHKNNGKTIGLHTLYFAYLTRADVPYSGGFCGSAMDFIEKLQSWNNGRNGLSSDGTDAFNDMREFIKDYISCFGQYHPKNSFWKAPVLQPLFRVWYENKAQCTLPELRDKLKKLSSGDGLRAVRFWEGMGAPRGNCQKAVADYLQAINGATQRRRLYITTSRNVVDRQGNKVKEVIRVFGTHDLEIVSP